ncbi:MAG TPA: flagellar basal body L-ring protein FlgH [Rhodocyclaceae bacterium]|jgi:flagellar L-ring protein precursor FlgH|nr:flagellar basal body L-ring protein FlgH [Rhodocyclaceae bacterium]
MGTRLLFAMLSAAMLSACVTTTPSTMVHQPMTARPEPRSDVYATQGAIYNMGGSRPLFEDRRARYVGDTITINIVENTSASKNSETKAKRDSSVDVTTPLIAGLPFKTFQGVSLNAGNQTDFDGSGSNTSANAFRSTLTCTVIEVLGNGNLLVSGEKQIGLKEGEEFVRFSGVVNPSMITAQNTVNSTQVADARLEFKANGFVDTAQVMGWLGRFFLSVLPF